MQLMGMSSNSSSSKLPQSGSSRQQLQQLQAQIECQDEKREDTKANDGFHPENRSATNIVKVTPPSVVIKEDETEHPLFQLHQSVSDTSREGNGNRGKQPPKHPQTQTLLPKRDSSSTMNGKGKTDTAHTKKHKRLTATVLLAVPIISLLFLGLPHVNSVINNKNLGDALNAMLSDLCTALSTAYLLIISLVKGLSRDKILSVLPSFDTRKVALPIGQLEQRIELGFDLLRKYDDASGSSAICESVLHSILDSHGEPQDESWTGSISSIALLFDIDENRLLSKAYHCLGEATLALLSSSIISRKLKKKLLTKAKESFESSTAIDPTDPSVRSGLGLVYLLLGMGNDEMSHNSQFIFQSIQHLRASIGLIDKSEYNQTGDATAIRTASMHNLGLAYLLLDEKTSSESMAGIAASHFIDWLTSLRSSHLAHSIIRSWAISSNEGAMLLQLGMLDDAILHLETARDVCSGTLPFSQQHDVCLTIHQNLQVARNTLNEKEAEQTGNYFPVGEENGNAGTLSSRDESGEHKGNIEVLPSLDPIKDDASIIPSTPFGPTAVNPEMHDALLALEKAAAEGTQRTHLLLSLARARVSTDDISGAVDATLRAVNAAKTVDEVDTSTTYLDKLMEKMAGRGSEQNIHIIKEDLSSGKSEESTKFVEKKDMSFLELEMKLELERLRYKVLEQEMRLGYQSNSEQGLKHFRAIDYQQELNDAARDTTPKIVSEVIDESVTLSQTMIKIVDYNADVNDIAEDSTLLLDNAQVNNTELEGLKPDANVSDANPEENSESVANEYAPSNIYILEEIQNTSISDDRIIVASDDSDSKAIQLPPLFLPVLKAPTPISSTAKSYMKMADAYLDKGQFAQASKQFLKVIKKAPEHLPAHLGFATALERAGNAKQIYTAALAYGNATQLAIIQGDEVDPLAITGAGGIAENILRRAMALAKTAPNRKLEILKELTAYAHTVAIAADLHYEIGLEIVSQGIEQEDKKRDAMQAFAFANEFIAARNDTQAPYHIGSMIERGKLALGDEDAQSVIDFFDKIRNSHMEDDAHVELLVLVGRAYVMLGELETAITEFTRAISFPESSSTASAHHELAATLKKINGDTHEINLHFEKALNLGMDPTSESIDALGENNMAVVRALRRQYYRKMNDGSSDSSTDAGGGIMSGGGVHATSSSSFAPRPKHNEDAATGQSETLAILEQGAASYDGNTPMGGEIEGTESSLSNLKAKKNQQGSESNLSSLKR